MAQPKRKCFHLRGCANAPEFHRCCLIVEILLQKFKRDYDIQVSSLHPTDWIFYQEQNPAIFESFSGNDCPAAIVEDPANDTVMTGYGWRELIESETCVSLDPLDSSIDAGAIRRWHKLLASSNRTYCYLRFTVGGATLPDVVIELASDIVPKTCENFRHLCIGDHTDAGHPSLPPMHYSGCVVVRVVPGFYIQTGDISLGQLGEGKSAPRSIWGGAFPDECFAIKHSVEGTVSMASHSLHGNGSQFFITLRPSPELDGKYVAFGRVISGIEAVRAIGRGPVRRNGMPADTACVFTLDVYPS